MKTDHGTEGVVLIRKSCNSDMVRSVPGLGPKIVGTSAGAL